MIPRMIIRGKEVPPIQVLLMEIDRVSEDMWDIPKGHPDLAEHQIRLDALTGRLLKMRGN